MGKVYQVAIAHDGRIDRLELLRTCSTRTEADKVIALEVDESGTGSDGNHYVIAELGVDSFDRRYFVLRDDGTWKTIESA